MHNTVPNQNACFGKAIYFGKVRSPTKEQKIERDRERERD
jgi:hypothetical protein